MAASRVTNSATFQVTTPSDTEIQLTRLFDAPRHLVRGHEQGRAHQELVGQPSIVTALLTEENGKTRLQATSQYPSKEVRDMVLSTGMERGAALSYDRLDEVSLALATAQK